MPSLRSRGAKRSISRSSAPNCRSAAASPTCSPRKAICCSARRSAPRVSSRARCSPKSSCTAVSVPTARYKSCDTAAQAIAVLRSGEFGFPVVLKADGLAAGKGVVIAADLSDAEVAGAVDDGRQAIRPGRRAAGHRRAARRARSVLLRAERRHARAAAGIRRRSQARARWRRRPEHGRHGRLRAKLAVRCGHAGARDERDRDARARRHAQRRQRVPRLSVRRTDADRGRPESHRVQRAVRRSGSAGDSADDRRRSVDAADERGGGRAATRRRVARAANRASAWCWRRAGIRIPTRPAR